MKLRFTKYLDPQRGLTLIELLIAMAIGLFVVGAVSVLYINTRSGFNYLEEVSRIQETGRFAIDTISRDIRMAGYNGCGKDVTTIANVVNGASSSPFLDFSTPIRGYGDGVAFPTALSSAGAISGTDAIVLLGVDTSSEMVVQNHNPSSAQIDTNTHSVKPGEILLITDCAKASIFQMTGPTNNNNNATNVVHNTGTGTPGNCTKFLGASCPSALTYTYKPGSSLIKIYSNAYFIANSSLNNGTRSLWSLALEGSTSGSAVAKELLVGVNNMQIYYGLDMDGDGSADRYVTADVVQSSGIWSKVNTVRISLLVTSTNTKVATGKQSYLFQTTSGSTTESTVTPGDRILRRVFSETVVARNRVM
ncbi:MAG: prepilin-type N-terminal cleavage/methylation domain-containing protein [Rhodocyclales bacterium GT-UBC]|nr:MAG: prepilin-type N-terminal cleavage/methylation domain-containing protein [Rhodocyclales bacterium GT-UBC]